MGFSGKIQNGFPVMQPCSEDKEYFYGSGCQFRIQDKYAGIEDEGRNLYFVSTDHQEAKINCNVVIINRDFA